MTGDHRSRGTRNSWASVQPTVPLTSPRRMLLNHSGMGRRYGNDRRSGREGPTTPSRTSAHAAERAALAETRLSETALPGRPRSLATLRCQPQRRCRFGVQAAVDREVRETDDRLGPGSLVRSRIAGTRACAARPSRSATTPNDLVASDAGRRPLGPGRWTPPCGWGRPPTPSPGGLVPTPTRRRRRAELDRRLRQVLDPQPGRPGRRPGRARVIRNTARP